MLGELTEKQIRDRIRFISDSIDTLSNNLQPMLEEFDSLKKEFEELFLELHRRGLLNVTKQPEDGFGENDIGS